MSVNTYIQLVNFIDDFATNHQQIQRFKAEFTEQLPNFATINEAYPILFMAPIGTQFLTNVDNFSVRFYCFDIIQKDRDNINLIISDTNTILNDLKKWFTEGDNYNWQIIGDPQATPLNNQLLDYAAGWTMDVTFNVSSYCVDEIPFSGSPLITIEGVDNVYSRYLTCETVTGCTSLQQYIFNEVQNLSGGTDTFVTGGTYNSTTGIAVFTNSTGGTFSITGFTSGSATDLYWTSGSTGTNSIKVVNGTSTDATGTYAVAEGSNTLASGQGSHAEGVQTTASGQGSHSEGLRTTSFGLASHVEGQLTIASGTTSHCEGYSTMAIGISSHAEGFRTTTFADYCHTEGINTVTLVKNSHAEGANTTASGDTSHSEGSGTTATGDFSHSQGLKTLASGQGSHAEGYLTIASGSYSHAGGQDTLAIGDNSFVHGSGSTANGNGAIVLGNNLSGTTDNTVYVNKLNIKDVPSGNTINNLGIDSSGNVIIGNSSSNIIKSTTTSAVITGVSGVVTLVQSVLIPANTFTVGDIIRVRQRGRKTGAGNSTSTIYINTSNTLTGASLLGTFTTVNSNNLFIQMKREFYIKTSTGTEGFNSTLTSATDDASVASSVTTTNIDWTVDQYIIFAVNPGSIANTYVVSGYIIERL